MKLSKLPGTLLLLIGAAVINVALFAMVSLLASERKPPQDMTDPTGVSLVSLKAPEPPQQEEVKEPEPPKPEPKPDFAPDLVRPSLAGFGPGDFAVSVNLGGLGKPQSASDFVFDSVDLDQAPQPVAKVPPPYPYRAREQGVEGYVAIKILVKEDGSVAQVQVLKAKPEGYFEETVRKSVPSWKFKPGLIGDEPVASWVITTVRFDLN